MYQIIQDEAAMAIYVQHAETLNKRRLLVCAHYWCVCSDRQPDLKQQAFFAVDLDKEPTTLRQTRQPNVTFPTPRSFNTIQPQRSPSSGKHASQTCRQERDLAMEAASFPVMCLDRLALNS